MTSAIKDPSVEAEQRIKELLMSMNGLSEAGFVNRMRNDPFFRSGFQTLVQLFLQAKFK